MKILADECVYFLTSKALREWGHNVVTAQEIGLSGAPDEAILRSAFEEKRLLVTNDLDFSNIRHYPPDRHYGIIVLKIRPHTLIDVHYVLKNFLESTTQEELTQTLVIVDRNKYRLRRRELQ